ncbi:MAG: restriction endonuclease subunit S [Bacteroidales bacterium]|nr:restriction endonuclease subunit S [Bacteroidales bacterium]
MSEPKNIPELRFPEFNGDWLEKRLEELFSEFKSGFGITSKKIDESGTYPVFGGNGLRGFTNSFTHDGFYLLIGRQGALCGNVNRSFDKAYISEHAIAGKANETSDTAWLAQRLEYYNLNRLSESSAQPGLSVNKLLRFKIIVPTKFEQQKIASFFTVIDQKISQLEQKKILLEQYKKGVMQIIFSQEIRFRDENGQEFPKWEKKKFNEVYSFKTTNSFSRDNLNFESGEVRNIHYGDIHTKYPTLLDIAQHDVPYINSDISKTKIKKDCYCIINDLIFADASEDVPDVGKCIEIINLNEEKVLAGLHTILARPDISKIANGFGGYLMASNGIRKQIMKISQGSKVTSISSSRLGEIEIDLPCQEEQSNIAKFLSAIDTKILNTQLQIENTELWKKGLLQKMFV